MDTAQVSRTPFHSLITLHNRLDRAAPTWGSPACFRPKRDERCVAAFHKNRRNVCTSKRRAPGFSLNFSKKDDRCFPRSWHCHSPLDGNLHHKSFFMGSFTLNPKIPFPFILLFGEKNEPRRAAAGYRALSLGRRRLARGLRNSLRSHSPRPLSSLGCRPPGPIRAFFFFSPLSLGAPSLLGGGVLSFPFSVIPRSTGNPRRRLCVITGCEYSVGHHQWAKSIRRLNVSKPF